jgi:hypothetical protein
MEKTLAAFIAELRAIGLPVSLSENIDAAAALRAIPLSDRTQVKSALAATLVKNHDHYRAFELAFDVFFGGRQLARLGGGTENGSGEASQVGFGAGTLLRQLTEEELNDLLFQAVAGRDAVLLRAVAAEAVDNQLPPRWSPAGTRAGPRTKAGVCGPEASRPAEPGVRGAGCGVREWSWRAAGAGRRGGGRFGRLGRVC